MPLVKPLVPASKYLAQKWETDRFRTHRLRVKDVPSFLDTSAPKQYPHLQLGLNRIAIQEDKQNRYDRENQLLLNKIKMIVKGPGTVSNWNQWSRRDLHAGARLKQQRQIDIENQAMLQRLRNTKPVIQRMKQKKDFEKHKTLQSMLEGSIKDYGTPRTRTESYASSRNGDHTSETSEGVKHNEQGQRPHSATSHSVDTEKASSSEAKDNLPPLPAGQKVKSRKPPPENRRKNRHADVPKLPAI